MVVFGGRAYDNTAGAHAGRGDMSVFSFLDEDVGGLKFVTVNTTAFRRRHGRSR